MDWQLTCRVCLETGDMVSLFDWDENNEQLGDKYTFCCGVEVNKNDTLPTLICLNCVDRLTYACQFKQQCLASNDTLKECLDEFLKTSAAVSANKSEEGNETETITIKQENGLLLQYELPVEHDPQAQWTRTLIKTPNTAVVTKAPGRRKRGRPRKYPNEQGQIDVSPYQRKKPKPDNKEPEALTTLLASGSLDLKQEPDEEEQDHYETEELDTGDDPDFVPGGDEPDSDVESKKEVAQPKKRGRPRKTTEENIKPKDEDSEDVLLKETIMAFSEPIPDHILNPKPKKKRTQPRKKYVYEKTHVCETCGASFTSNASLQAHIRRHLGIKPFVCRYSAKSLPDRVCSHNSKALKCATLTMAQLKELQENFYKHKNKKDQDTLILKYCRIEPVKRRADFKGTKQTTIKYAVFLRNVKVPICQKLFLSLFNVTKHRVAYVMNRFFHAGDIIIHEKRGGNRKEHLYEEQKLSIHNFIQKLQCVESHYCRKTKTAERKYLSSDLNINKLYKLYKNSEYSNAAVKPSYFRHNFNSCYNVGFGTPNTDACSKCLELVGKIVSETDPDKKALLVTEKNVHSLRAKAFYEKLKDDSKGLKILSFDCQKNLPLPKLPDQMAYYSRQLYFFNFTVVEGVSNIPLSKESVFTYYCMENEFNKDSNLVASAITHRLNHTDLTGITNIRLVADGCGGQNKNSILVGACSKWLLEHQYIKTIELVFPVTGHSFTPADRQFGIAEKKMRKMEVILHPDEIKNILGETSTLIKFGTDCPVFNWRDALKSVLKPTTSWNISFKECKRFILRRSKIPGNVLVRGELYYQNDLGKAVNICQRNKTLSNMIPKQLPNIVTVNKNKLSDIKKLLQKHFGPDWRDIAVLSIYKDILDTQENLNAPEFQENYCEGPLEEAKDMRI